ncbi:hypothetical protein L1S35_09420 [Flavobacterium sp. AS60]|uniref:hypothetical protein n=1 Tax=Flavobacterium anseongense TaxID=2910677 RepID=UPI001F45827A|nr:hypothetical protein [Flavobacterium sp. AS60]MCF6129894.1 hypothetical protein [Flavobacterium sp. AS60]
MKNRIIFFLGSLMKFIAFTAFVYVVFIIGFGLFMPKVLSKNLSYKRGSNGHLFSRVNEINEYKNVDVLFLGSSHAYRGFDPRIFQKHGLKTFNLGSSAQTPIQTELLLNRYLDKLKPKLVVYEVYPGTFALDGVESALDIISNDENDSETIKMALELNNIKVYNTMIYGFFRDIFHLNKNYKEKIVKKYDTYVKGGFVERNSLYFKGFKSLKNKSDWEFKVEQFDAFKRNLDKLKAMNISYVLVQAPITSQLYKSHTNNEYFDNKMKTYGKYYNFNGKLNLVDSLHFYDEHHLNQKGVELFDDFLLKELPVLNKK